MGELFLGSVEAVTWQRALLSVLIAYLFSQAIAAVYVWTHRGVSYSRSLVVSLVVAGLVSSVLMLAIGNNLARGLGIMGTLALIRFRTNLFDPLDTLYVFASFASGLAAGTGTIVAGAVGTAAFLTVVATLQLTDFGARHRHDGVLRFQLAVGGDGESSLTDALAAHCRALHGHQPARGGPGARDRADLPGDPPRPPARGRAGGGGGIAARLERCLDGHAGGDA